MSKDFTKKERFLKNRIECGELAADDLEEVPGLMLHHRTWVMEFERYNAEPYIGRFGIGFIVYPGIGYDDELTEKDYWIVSDQTPDWVKTSIKIAIRRAEVNYGIDMLAKTHNVEKQYDK